MDLEDFEFQNNEFVIKSHKVAEQLKKKGFKIKKPVWENHKAS